LLCQLSYTARGLWQDSNLRPSKEPLHITTGEPVVHPHRRGMGDAVPAFLPAADRSHTAPK